jgi:hypothetical protein
MNGQGFFFVATTTTRVPSSTGAFAFAALIVLQTVIGKFFGHCHYCQSELSQNLIYELIDQPLQTM